MTTPIPDTAHDLLSRPITAGLITVMPDGQPQATPVWFDFDGENIRVNTAEGRQKTRNMARDSKVTLLIIDPQNPFHWLEWRGHVAEICDAENGAVEHIRVLSNRYTGSADYQIAPDEQRVMVIIAADKINAQ